MEKQKSPATPDTVPASKETASQGWVARQKRRWESLLAWIAKGAEHTCPT